MQNCPKKHILGPFIFAYGVCLFVCLHVVINMPPRWGDGAGVAGILVGGGGDSASSRTNKYDGDDGCGSMMMEDGKMKLMISVVSDDG